MAEQSANNLGTSPDDIQFRFRDDEVADHAQVTVDAFLEQSNAAAVRIEPGDDARALIPHLERLRLVEVNFPVFGDGRGYSSARILREAGYSGELRAVGEVLVDQIGYMRRCGFDSFAPDTPIDEDDAKTAFARWPFDYQRAADARRIIAELRHE
jgi:uncharacterized protein (DUF934 family)